MAKAEKTTGIIPPTNNIAKTGALKRFHQFRKRNIRKAKPVMLMLPKQ
jgi:hypothetical protein